MTKPLYLTDSEQLAILFAWEASEITAQAAAEALGTDLAGLALRRAELIEKGRVCVQAARRHQAERAGQPDARTQMPCRWCHTLNYVQIGREVCYHCGHWYRYPRMLCRCPQCRPLAESVPAPQPSLGV